MKTVLLVEDDEDTRSIYAAALEDAGYRVVIATQGAEGVHLARRTHPDLILLDLRMPVMTGWGTARYLKADPETRSIPICAVSAYDAQEEGIDDSAAVPFDSYLRKPVDPRDVLAEVGSWIGPGEKGPPSQSPLPAE